MRAPQKMPLENEAIDGIHIAMKVTANKVAKMNIAFFISRFPAPAIPEIIISINPRIQWLFCFVLLVRLIMMSSAARPVNLARGPAPGVGTKLTGSV